MIRGDSVTATPVTSSASKNRRDNAPVPTFKGGLTHFCWARTYATLEEGNRRMQLPIPIQIPRSNLYQDGSQ